MVLVIASLGGLFVLGLVLLIWGLAHALRRHHQGIRPSHFMWQVERIGSTLITLSLWIAALYAGFFQLPGQEQLWLSGLFLVGGVFLMIVVMTGTIQRLVHSIVMLLMPSSTTRGTHRIVERSALVVQQVGQVMALTSFALLLMELLLVVERTYR